VGGAAERQVPVTAPAGDDLLQAAADAARAAVLTRFRPDSCIATTRVVIEVLRAFGVPARPWPVNVKIFNAAAWPLANARVPVAEWPGDAWSVGIDVRNGRDGVGHLVAVSGLRMIDASIDQASRPGMNMELVPLVAPIPEGFDLAGGRELLYGRGDSGVRLTYGPSGSRVFASSPHWRRDNADVRACAGQAIRAVRLGVRV
jgi:hypothetical protein